MSRASLVILAFVAVLVLLAAIVGYQDYKRGGDTRNLTDSDTEAPAPPAPPAPPRPPARPGAETTQPPAGGGPADPPQGVLYGRVVSVAGDTYEGRLRFGGDQEAFWGDFFNGVKKENPWAANVPPEQLPKRNEEIKVFGLQFAQRQRTIDLGRRFMARFGDIARIEPKGRDVRVTLKNGTVFDLDRYNSSDFDDGLRVWDKTQGEVDFDSAQIRSIELLATPASLDTGLYRLHGTVHTRIGDFTGFVQWDREECVGSDELDGNTTEGKRSLRFDSIRSIARKSPQISRVTLTDGQELELSGTNDVNHDNRGIYVDDKRYGRVLISWDAFQRVDFTPAGTGPAYGDFPPSRPLTGTVVTRAGARLTGRLVYDLDESETIETFDAPQDGVDYTIPFGLIASIAPPGPNAPGARFAKVTLQSGEELQLGRTGDLSDTNAGLLVFVDGRESPEYVLWTDVDHVDVDRPPAVYPPIGDRWNMRGSGDR